MNSIQLPCLLCMVNEMRHVKCPCLLRAQWIVVVDVIKALSYSALLVWSRVCIIYNNVSVPRAGTLFHSAATIPAQSTEADVRSPPYFPWGHQGLQVHLDARKSLPRLYHMGTTPSCTPFSQAGLRPFPLLSFVPPPVHSGWPVRFSLLCGSVSKV